MMQIRSPRWLSRFALTSDGWSALRAEFAAHIYPHGVPTSGVDTVTANYTGGGIVKPTGCATVTRYAINSPGQRPGGDPQYTYLLRCPAPNGKLVVWLCGHSGWGVYATADEGFTLQALLADGYDVLVCDMPLFHYAANPGTSHIVVGGSWSHSNGSWTNAGGALTGYTSYHAFSALDSDGGPQAILWFLHHLVLSVNEAFADLSPTEMILAGHSGGGIISHFLGAIDGRFSALFTNVPGLPLELGGTPVGAMTDWEQCALAPCYSRGPMLRDIWGILRVAASWPNRKTDLVSALHDEYWTPPNVPLWIEMADTIAEHVAVTGARFSYWLDPAAFPGHVMNTTRISRMIGLMDLV